MTDMFYTSQVAALHQELGIPADYAHRGLAFHRYPESLSHGAEDPNGVPMQMEPRTAVAWARMKDAASRDGVVLLVESAFRDLAQQAALIRDALKNGGNLDAALQWIAAPGYSEHHTGRAIDIACPGCYPVPVDDAFEKTGAFIWLVENAKRSGFQLSYPRGNPHGIIYEPWHWCWNEPAEG